MAFPGALSSTAISDVIATTIESRSGEIADNVTDNNPLLAALKKRGRIKTVSGGDTILQELNYDDSTTRTVNSYSGYETIAVTANSPISAARFDYKQYAASITMSGLEMLQNSGKEAVLDLLDARMEIAESQMANRIDTDLYLDGTGNGSKNVTGLAAAVATAPTSGTYGSIDRATWAFWRNIAFDATTDGGAAATAANIQSYMHRTALQVVRGRDKPDLIVADNTYYRLYLESLTAIQRVSSDGDKGGVGSGFTSLKYFGAGFNSDVVLGGGIGAHETANRMFFLNTNYLHWRPHADRNMVPIGGERMAVNQDAIVKLIGWAGNLTCSGARYQAVLGD
jgi:hypothetical protein